MTLLYEPMDLFVKRNTQARSSRAPSQQQTTATPRRTDVPPAKRLKVADPENSENDSIQILPDEYADSESDPSGLGFEDSQVLDPVGPNDTSETAIEIAMPSLATDKGAIEEYQIFRASQGSATDDGKFTEVDRRKSSIYVDAFNLALETVLQDESHLFDEKEMAVFGQWKQLDYEAQYL